jgi:hypothetical protein
MPHVFLQHHLTGSKGRLGISIFNAGLGPALITKCDTLVDGEPLPNNSMDAAVAMLGLGNLEMSYETVASPYVLPAGERVWLLSTAATAESLTHLPEIDHALDRLRLTISYESIYGQKRTAEFPSGPS